MCGVLYDVPSPVCCRSYHNFSPRRFLPHRDPSLAATLKPTVPDFKTAIDHFGIHAGGRAVIDAIQVRTLFIHLSSCCTAKKPQSQRLMWLPRTQLSRNRWISMMTTWRLLVMFCTSTATCRLPPSGTRWRWSKRIVILESATVFVCLHLDLAWSSTRLFSRRSTIDPKIQTSVQVLFHLNKRKFCLRNS